MISTACTFVAFALLSNFACAGLQSVLMALYDGCDALNRPREFVAPFAGNNVPAAIKT
jgi:hypothetical protein